METENKVEKRRSFLVNFAYWAIIFAIIYVIFKYALIMMMPFFLAAIFASVSRPLARWLSRDIRYKKGPDGKKVPVKRRLRLNESFAGILSVLLLFLVLGGLVVLVAVQMIDSVSDAVAAIPSLYYSSILPGLEEIFEEIEDFAARFDPSVLEAVQEMIPAVISNLGTAVTGLTAKMLSWLSSFAGSLPSALLNTVICLIATVFIAVDFTSIQSFICRNLPARPLEVVRNVKNSFLEIIWQFIKSYFLIFLITATEITLGLLLLRMNHPLLIGMLIAIFDAFPIVGSGMILLPWAVITLISGATWRGLGLVALYLVVVIVRQIIEPKIVGKHVGLRPIITLTCMFVGTRLFGGLGLFGVPIAAAIIVDMNNSGLIHLFKRGEKSSEAAGEEGATA